MRSGSKLCRAIAALACAASAATTGGCDASSAQAGASIYRAQGCITCHGETGSGTALGPALAGARDKWDVERLAEYFRDPEAYAAKDPRLAEQAKQYSLPMPRYSMLEPVELKSLAKHVLAAH